MKASGSSEIMVGHSKSSSSSGSSSRGPAKNWKGKIQTRREKRQAAEVAQAQKQRVFSRGVVDVGKRSTNSVTRLHIFMMRTNCLEHSHLISLYFMISDWTQNDANFHIFLIFISTRGHSLPPLPQPPCHFYCLFLCACVSFLLYQCSCAPLLFVYACRQWFFRLLCLFCCVRAGTVRPNLALNKNRH